MELISIIGRFGFTKCNAFRLYSNYYLQNETLRKLSCAVLKTGFCLPHQRQSLPRNVFPSKLLVPVESSSRLCTSSLLSKKKGLSDRHRRQVKGTADPPTELADDLEDERFDALVASVGGSLMGVNLVAVIQPWVKWGPQKRVNTKPELLLTEACALVKSLPFVRVSYETSVPLQRVSRTQVFGSGSLARLSADIRASGSQAVFVSLEHLNATQKSELEGAFGVPVFDRFFAVLSLFRHHARTVEARLQVAMAEVPFMSRRCESEKEKVVVDEREAALKAALKRLAGRRERARRSRRQAALPSVAVVGYTNCGKTSLIGALTGDGRAVGVDRLFATVDVTAHRGRLPCGVPVVFLDSVGFLQDIPTGLLAAFHATLVDVVHADVVVLVEDASHPDLVSQRRTVAKTLRDLALPEATPLIRVSNKADLLLTAGARKEGGQEEGIFTSTLTGEGLPEVVRVVERAVLRVTGRKTYHMRLPTGSPKIHWLKETLGVLREEADASNPQETHLHVLMNEAEKAAFRRAFG